MVWPYLIVAVFSILSLHFLCGDYKKKKFSSKAFAVVGIAQAVVIVASVVMIIKSL